MTGKDSIKSQVSSTVQKMEPFKDKIVSKVNDLEQIVENAVEKPIEIIGAKTLLFGTSTGYLSGLALAKSGLASLSAVRNAASGKDLTLAKVWLSSVGTGFLCYGTASLAGLLQISALPANLWLNLIGGTLSGVSAYLAGTTPELLYVQLPKGDPRSVWTLIGGLMGTAAYGAFFSKMIKYPLFSGVCPAATTLHQYFNVPFYALAIPMTAAAVGACYFLENLPTRPVVVPATSRPSPIDPPLMEPVSAGEMLYQKRWNPYFCGAILGLAQIPAYYVTKTLLNYDTHNVIMGQLFSMLNLKSVYLESVKFSAFKVLFNVGLFLGSFHALNQLKKKLKGAPSTTVNIEPFKRPKPTLDTAMKLFYVVSGFGLFFGANLCKENPLGVSQLGIGSIVTTLAMAKAACVSSYLEFLL